MTVRKYERVPPDRACVLGNHDWVVTQPWRSIHNHPLLLPGFHREQEQICRKCHTRVVLRERI